MRIPSCALLLFAIFLAGCAPTAPSGDISHDVAPIYVSIVCHNEEPSNATAVAYSEDREYFMLNRDATVEFARMLHSEGVTFNFQPDWDFALGVLNFDQGSHSTGNKNVLRYLVYNLAFEVDPHAHENQYNYADVAHLHEQAGAPVSHLAGGLLALPSENSKLEYLWSPLRGAQFDCAWKAEAVWGGGTADHVNEEALWISGIWKPQDNAHFTTHDEGAPLPHIGGYKDGWDGLRNLLQHQEEGGLDASRIYTQSIFVRQADLLDPAFVLAFKDEIRSFSEKTEAGLLRWVGLNEVLDIWETEYDCRPNLFRYS